MRFSENIRLEGAIIDDRPRLLKTLNLTILDGEEVHSFSMKLAEEQIASIRDFDPIRVGLETMHEELLVWWETRDVQSEAT